MNIVSATMNIKQRECWQ